jgi:voltage-gated potassium channel Kch
VSELRLHKHISTGLRSFFGRLGLLLRQPIFIALTLVGNTCILAGATAFYQVEHGINPHVHSMLDALWWAVATVTTVGYGDISPVSTQGKIIGMFMMIGGTGLFCSFTALFAGALISTEIEREVRKVEEEVEHAVAHDDKTLHELITTVETALSQIKRMQRNRKGGK